MKNNISINKQIKKISLYFLGITFFSSTLFYISNLKQSNFENNIRTKSNKELIKQINKINIDDYIEEQIEIYVKKDLLENKNYLVKEIVKSVDSSINDFVYKFEPETKKYIQSYKKNDLIK
jgi:hypothetical protein